MSGLDLYKVIKNTLRSLNTATRISLANAENFNTPGFKYTTTSFTTVFSETISSGTTTVNPKSIPGSITVGATTTDFSQGTLNRGSALDAAIVGEGFFILSAAANEFSASAARVYTRAGIFRRDRSGNFLVDSFGRTVFGFRTNADGIPINNELVPIEIDGETDLGIADGGVVVADFEAARQDAIAGVAEPRQQRPLFRLALASFPNKQGLVLDDGAAWRPTFAAGTQLTESFAEQGIYGRVFGQSREGSNVDVTDASLDFALINRGYAAIQGVIDDVNKIISQTISKLS